MMQGVFASRLSNQHQWVLTSDWNNYSYSSANIEGSLVQKVQEVHSKCGSNGEEVLQFEKFCLIQDNGVVGSGNLVMCDDISHGQIYEFLNGQLAEEADEENEIQAHTLDHIYAKKPREPGSEPVKPVRRRSRKKEMITNQYVIQEMVQHDGPRINIIRQPLPGLNGYKPMMSRPRIAKTAPPPSSKGEGKWKRKEPTVKKEPEVVMPPIFDECEVPQLGALVTISDSDSKVQTTATTSAPLNQQPYRKSYPKTTLPEYVELPLPTDTDLENLGDDEAELFFDFPMDDETEPLEDLDFCELSLAHAMNTPSFDASPHSLQLQSKLELQSPMTSTDSESILGDYEGSDESYLDDEDSNYMLLPKSDSDLYSNLKLASLRDDLCLDEVMNPAELSPQKPMKLIETWKPEVESIEPKPTPKPPSPVRRSSRPSRTPSRLDSDDMILSPPKRSYKRFKT